MPVVSRVVLIVLATFVAVPATAQAVTIDFEGPALSDGTQVSSQFAGVTFEAGPPLGAPSLPAMRTADARSGTHTLDISESGDEFPTPRVVGRFDQTRQTVTVRLRNVTAGVFATTMRLELWDASGSVVASTSASVSSSNPGYTDLTATSVNAIADVLRFQVIPTTPATAQGQEIRLDDLEFTGASATPDFGLSSANPGVLILPQGKPRSTTIGINRVNGSTGNIAFSATNFGTALTTSFAPNPAGGTSAATVVTFTPDQMVSGPTTIEVTGTPVAGAGPAPRRVNLPVRFVPPFTLSSPQTERVFVPACSAQDVPLEVERAETVDDTVALSTEGGAGGLPAGWSASVDPSSVSGIAGNATVRVTRGDTPSSQLSQVVVRATSGSLPEATKTFEVRPDGMTVTSVATIGPLGPVVRARAPQTLQPGDPVLISGTGICPSAHAEFGSSAGSAPLTQVSPGVYRAIVPRLASDGPVKVVNAGTAEATSEQRLDIQTYRDTNGFSFANRSWNGGLEDWEELFGADQMRVSVDFCPPYGCNVVSPFLRPDASIYMIAWNEGLRGGNGTCFGFALGSRRIITGQRPGMLTGAQTLWDLPFSDALFNYLRVQHIAQASAEFMNRYLAQRLAGSLGTRQSSVLRRDLEDRLRAGHPPIIALARGGQGHAIVAYDVEDRPGSGYFIRVWDNNVPATIPERSNASAHLGAEQNSRIEVTESGWTYPNLPGGGQPAWTGTMADIAAVGAEEIPVRPTIPLTMNGVQAMIFGAGTTGGPVAATRRGLAGGDTLPPGMARLSILDGSGTDAFVGRTDRTRSYAVRADSRGRQQVSSFGDGNAIHVTASGPAGGAAQVNVLPGGDGVRYETQSPATTLQETLTSRAAGGATHVATISTRSFAGGGDALAFDRSGRTLTFGHDGRATTLTLDLSSFGGGSAPSRFRGTLSLRPGDRVSVAPGWSKLGGPLRVTIRGKGGTRRVALANAIKPALVVRTVKTTARRSGKRILVTISARLTGRSAGATEAFAAAIRLGKRTVGKGARLLSGKKARTSARVTLTIPVGSATGRLQVRSSVTALSGTPVPLTSAKRATVAVR